MIRPSTPEDAEAVARVHVAAWRTAYAHALPPGPSLADRTDLHRRFPPTFVAEIEGEIVGFVGVGACADDWADGELFAIYVRPDHWGTGVGRSLIERAEERFRELGLSDCVLWVLDDNPRARRFYERVGWFADGAAREIELFGIQIPEVRYRKTL
jgi:GNAT superfamily N-acetyltransferase